jgi:hypothetical protein
MNSVRPDLDNNLVDYIYHGRNSEFSLSKTSIIENISDMKYPVDNILNKYMSILKNYFINVTLTDEEMTKYSYQPKKLSLDLYGTIELWFLLIRINNLTSISEFNKKKIKIFHPDYLDILNKIMIKEKDYLDKKGG